MLKIALTGGIATGKTHVLRRFHEFGVPTVDADVIARDVVQPGAPTLQAVVERFGREILREDGTLDRARLGALVFSDTVARHDLEAILHPAIYRAIQDALSAAAAAAVSPIAIADIPLLYETGREKEFDRVIVTACHPDEQLKRVVARDGLSEAAARQRIAAQLPIAEKVARADYVIRTDGTFDDTDRQVEEVYRALTAAR